MLIYYKRLKKEKLLLCLELIPPPVIRINKKETKNEFSVN